MADKTLIATLKKVDEKDCLSFKFNDDKSIDIDLNSDDQAKLKELFYELIQRQFNDNIIISLTFGNDYDQNNIFANIAREYIQALNTELQTVKSSLPQK